MILSKAKLSALRKYQQKKVRVAESAFLIEGWHLIEEYLNGCSYALNTLVHDHVEDVNGGLLERAKERAKEVFAASSDQLAQLSDTKTPQGVVALVNSNRFHFEELLSSVSRSDCSGVVILDAVSDPGNCGTIIRTADWFGCDGVVLGPGCAELENGKTVRSTMGSLFHLPICKVDDLVGSVRALQGAGVKVYSSELNNASSIEDFEWPEKAAVVIGNEARGVSTEVSESVDGKLFIPRFGKAESLNAATAASVLLGHWKLK